MTFLNQITVLILTCNEEANIGRTLEAVKWAKRILVIDSGSNDATLAIINRYPQAHVVTRTFDSFAAQCNFGLSQISTPWVLSLDADYEVSEPLAREIKMLSPREGLSGYRASFIYRIYGRSLRTTLYPPRTVLYLKDRAKYRDEGHGHRVVVEGEVWPLNAPIYHDDRKPLSCWLASQQKYAKLEADHLLSGPLAELRQTDRIRLMGWPAPILVFCYTLIVKRCILDGWPGWFYALQRTLAETIIALEIVDRRLRRTEATDPLPPRIP